MLHSNVSQQELNVSVLCAAPYTAIVNKHVFTCAQEKFTFVAIRASLRPCATKNYEP